MQQQNIIEYKLIRAEITSLKKCITDYLGALFVGAGIIFSAWGGISLIKENTSLLPIAYSACSISLVSLSILFILIYKFISHNRYAGYCMLLNQEIWVGSYEEIKSILAWEWIVELLRESDLKNRINYNKYKKMSVEDKSDMDTPSDLPKDYPKSSAIKGFNLLLKSLISLQKTSSWGFPISVLRVFTIFNLSFMVFAFYLIAKSCPIVRGSTNIINCYLPWIVYVIFFVFHTILWSYICNRFYSIMLGNYTVKNFCKRLLPIRKKILSEYRVKATWKLIENNDTKSPDTQN